MVYAGLLPGTVTTLSLSWSQCPTILRILTFKATWQPNSLINPLNTLCADPSQGPTKKMLSLYSWTTLKEQCVLNCESCDLSLIPHIFETFSFSSINMHDVTRNESHLKS